jgi:hypothetical protein
VEGLADTQERLNGLCDCLGKIRNRIEDKLQERLCTIPDRLRDGEPDRLDQIWDCYMFKHYPPERGSDAALADLHAYVQAHRDDSLHMAAVLDSYLNAAIYQATRYNNTTPLRKYIRAVEMTKRGGHRKLTLTTKALIAWRELRTELGRPPVLRELEDRVRQMAESFTPRQWRRVLDDISELI